MPHAPIRWETVTCPLCGAADDREFLRTSGDGIEFRLGRCDQCGMVFTNPRPDEPSVAQFYTEDYPEYQAPRHRRTGFLRGLRERLGLRGEKTISDRIPVRTGGIFLDYGCGSGCFAAQMRDRGWQAVGMDFSAHAVATARQKFGLTAVHGTLPHPAVPPGSVDVIALRQVLEHIHHPRELLTRVYDTLRPGGWLSISLPNLASWGFRTFRTSWFPLQLPWHMLHFTPETLCRLVETCGFEVTAITTQGHTKWMGVTIARAVKAKPRWWVKMCRLHAVRSVVTRWTAWTLQGDDLALLARKPEAVTEASAFVTAA
jgi:SAM-dependent methyltransferase